MNSPRRSARGPLAPHQSNSQLLPIGKDGADAASAPVPLPARNGVTGIAAGILPIGKPASDDLIPRLASSFVLPCLALLFLGFTSATNADVIVQAQSFADRKTDFVDNATLAFDAFDTLGDSRTLEQVTIRYEQTLRTHVTIPKPPKGAKITVNVGSADAPLSLTTSSPFGLGLDPADPTKTSLTTQLDPIQIVWPASEKRAFTQNWTQTSELTRTFTSPAELARFMADPFTLIAAGNAWSRYRSSTGSGGALIRTDADVRVSLEYVYRNGLSPNAVVPEPASLALAAVGFVGLVCLARRRPRGR